MSNTNHTITHWSQQRAQLSTAAMYLLQARDIVQTVIQQLPPDDDLRGGLECVDIDHLRPALLRRTAETFPSPSERPHPTPTATAGS